MSKGKTTARARGQPVDLEKEYIVTYRLADLPSSQHRAGLAGLVLMTRWLNRQRKEFSEAVQIEDIDEKGASLRLSGCGLKALMDEVYGAAMGEVRSKTQRKDRNKKPVEPLRIDKEPELDKTGEPKLEKSGEPKLKSFYVYPQTVPGGAFLAEEDVSKEGSWIKLWRDMVWTILRGVPATRRPFEERAKSTDPEDWLVEHKMLSSEKERSVELPSTYYLGAQAVTAENVPFKDQAKAKFLLHFWPFVVPLFVPRTMDREGNTKWGGNSYVVVIPDIIDLEAFCEEYPELLRSRNPKTVGYRPAESLIDLPEEGALKTQQTFWQRLEQVLGPDADLEDLVLGFDVFATSKEGNNVRIDRTGRVDASRELFLGYQRLADVYWHTGFRRQRLLNLLENKPWYHGLGRYMSTAPRGACFDSKEFRHDAREAFKLEVEVKEMTEDIGKQKEAPEKTLEELLYQVVGTYLGRKLDTKYGLRWEEVKTNEGKKVEYGSKREKLAKEAFLAARSRTGADFIEYFTATLFSVSQNINKQSYLSLSRCLLNETDRVRTLTLLALSAQG